MYNKNSLIDHKLPDYGRYNFSSIAKSFHRLLGLTSDHKGLPDDCFLDFTSDRVVVFFIDAMGFTFLDRIFKENSFFKNFCDEALVSKITSNFPSTTTNHVVAFSTGLTPGESGLIEWQQYFSPLDKVIYALPSIAITKAGAEDLTKTTTHDTIFPQSQIILDLVSKGINVHGYKPFRTTSSLFSESLRVYANEVGYESLPKGLEQLVAQVNSTSGLYSFYYEQFDSNLHEWGTVKNPAFNNINYFFNQFEKIFFNKLEKNTSIIFIADHGQIDIDPKTTINLNEIYPEIFSKMKTTKEGLPICPCGSARDVFLHIKEDQQEEVFKILTLKLNGSADVLWVKDCIKDNYFGGASDLFLKNVGDILILPHRNQSVWFNHVKSFENTFYAHHGGLSPDEMEVPFIHYAFKK